MATKAQFDLAAEKLLGTEKYSSPDAWSSTPTWTAILKSFARLLSAFGMVMAALG